MKIRRNSIISFLFILALLVSARVHTATFTSSLPLEPAELVVPFGETFYVTLPGGLLELPDLPDNEYYGEVSCEYHWRVAGCSSGDGLTAVIPSLSAGGAGVISSPGRYTVVFTGKATYTVRWMENGVEHSSEPQEVELTASTGGRLSITFWLVATERIDITGKDASGTVSDRTSNLLRGTKYTFKAYRIPANSPSWPSGYPAWSSLGVGISADGDECVGTFYSGGDGKTLTVACGSHSKTATFNSVTPQIQRVEFHWDTQGIDIFDKEDKWQAGIGGLPSINDPACYIQGQKGKARLKFYASKNLTFPVTVSLRGDVHWFDEDITGEDYGRDAMTFGTNWNNTGIIESEANAESTVKDDYDVDISWRYKVRSPHGSDEWIDTGDTDNLRYYLVWAQPQAPQKEPWNRVLEMAVNWAEGEDDKVIIATQIISHLNNAGFTYQGNPSYIYKLNNIDYFYLSDCLLTFGLSSVNCWDVANMACIFSNAIGCNGSLEYMAKPDSTFLLNYIKPIGGSWTNDPFPTLGRDGFASHWTMKMDDKIYDACLHLDGDTSPLSLPCTALLPVNLDFDIGTTNIMFDDYRGKLVDPIDENSVQNSSIHFYPLK